MLITIKITLPYIHILLLT